MSKDDKPKSPHVLLRGRPIVCAGGGGFFEASEDCKLGKDVVKRTNKAFASDLVNGASCFLINGTPVATMASYIGKSIGDGDTDKGIKSGTVEGEAYFLEGVPDFTINGSPIIVHGCRMIGNNGNTEESTIQVPGAPPKPLTRAEEVVKRPEIQPDEKDIFIQYLIDIKRWKSLIKKTEAHIVIHRRDTYFKGISELCGSSLQEYMERLAPERQLLKYFLTYQTRYYQQAMNVGPGNRDVLVELPKSSVELRFPGDIFYSKQDYFDIRREFLYRPLWSHLKPEDAKICKRDDDWQNRCAPVSFRVKRSQSYGINSYWRLHPGHYVYLFRDGRLWAEWRVDASGELCAVDLVKFCGKDIRVVEGAKEHCVWMPLHNLDSAEIDWEVAVSPVQWSWSRINELGSFDAMFIENHIRYYYTNRSSQSAARSKRCQKISILPWASQWELGADKPETQVFDEHLIGGEALNNDDSMHGDSVAVVLLDCPWDDALSQADYILKAIEDWESATDSHAVAIDKICDAMVGANKSYSKKLDEERRFAFKESQKEKDIALLKVLENGLRELKELPALLQGQNFCENLIGDFGLSDDKFDIIVHLRKYLSEWSYILNVISRALSTKQSLLDEHNPKDLADSSYVQKSISYEIIDLWLAATKPLYDAAESYLDKMISENMYYKNGELRFNSSYKIVGYNYSNILNIVNDVIELFSSHLLFRFDSMSRSGDFDGGMEKLNKIASWFGHSVTYRNLPFHEYILGFDEVFQKTLSEKERRSMIDIIKPMLHHHIESAVREVMSDIKIGDIISDSSMFNISSASGPDAYRPLRASDSLANALSLSATTYNRVRLLDKINSNERYLKRAVVSRIEPILPKGMLGYISPDWFDSILKSEQAYLYRNADSSGVDLGVVDSGRAGFSVQTNNKVVHGSSFTEGFVKPIVDSSGNALTKDVNLIVNEGKISVYETRPIVDARGDEILSANVNARVEDITKNRFKIFDFHNNEGILVKLNDMSRSIKGPLLSLIVMFEAWGAKDGLENFINSPDEESSWEKFIRYDELAVGVLGVTNAMANLGAWKFESSASLATRLKSIARLSGRLATWGFWFISINNFYKSFVHRDKSIYGNSMVLAASIGLILKGRLVLHLSALAGGLLGIALGLLIVGGMYIAHKYKDSLEEVWLRHCYFGRYPYESKLEDSMGEIIYFKDNENNLENEINSLSRLQVNIEIDVDLKLLRHIKKAPYISPYKYGEFYAIENMFSAGSLDDDVGIIKLKLYGYQKNESKFTIDVKLNKNVIDSSFIYPLSDLKVISEENSIREFHWELPYYFFDNMMEKGGEIYIRVNYYPNGSEDFAFKKELVVDIVNTKKRIR